MLIFKSLFKHIIIVFNLINTLISSSVPLVQQNSSGFCDCWKPRN